MFKKFLTVSLILCLFSTYTLASTNSFVKADEHHFNSLGESRINLEAADPAVLRVLPENITGVSINETFNISVVVENVVDLYGFDVQLKWDPTIIHCVSWELHVPVEDYPDGVLHSPVIVIMNMVDESDNISGAEPGTMGWWVASSMAPAEPFTGNGTIATLTFQVVDWGSSTIEFVCTMLSDQNGVPIQHDTEDGYFKTVTGEIHDVAITYVTVSPSEVNSGDSVYIEVGVTNEGTATETFDVTTYFDKFSIETLTVTSLYPGESRVISFYWNTSGVPEGVYTIKAVADTVPGETDTQDNVYIDGTVRIISAIPVLEGIKVAYLSAYGSYHDGEYDRFVELGAVVTRLYPADINNIDLTYLAQFDVVYIPFGFACFDDLRYAVENKASVIKDYVSLGGGLIVEQPNLANYIPNVLPYPVKVTDVWWPDDGNDIVIVDPNHPITQGLTDADMFGIADTVPLSEVDSHYHILTKTRYSDCLALAVLEYGNGKIAFHLGNWDWPQRVVCPASDLIIGRVFHWVAKPTLPVLNVTLDFHPEALNLRSRGKWVSCRINLPEKYKAKDVDVSTILLNGTIPAEIVSRAKGTSFLIMKLDRQEVIGLILENYLLSNRFGTVTLTVTGKLNDGTSFQGSTTVRVIMPSEPCKMHPL